MGIVVIYVLIGTEVTLAVGRLRGWFPRRSFVPLVRASVVGVFGILVLTGVIRWGPRWYMLAIWLTALAAVSALRVARSQWPPSTVRVVGTSAVVVVASVVAVAPALIFPEYQPLKPTGPLPVASHTYSITDPSRPDPFSKEHQPRSLTYEVWYPDVTEGSFPLVVFSHGSMGIRTSNQSLFEDLASHGYVVVSIDHTGHALYSRTGDGKLVLVNRDYLRELQSENARKDPEQSLRYYRKWMALRMDDIDSVLDEMLGKAVGSHDVPFTLVDPDRIGLIGHSLGGAAVIGVGRQRSDVDAVVALESPYMTEITGVENDRFVWSSDPYPVPVLNVYSDSAWDHLKEWPQYARNAQALDDPNTTNIHLEGVGHLHLTDLSLSSPLLTRLLNGHRSTADPRSALRRLNSDVLRFLDTHVARP